MNSNGLIGKRMDKLQLGSMEHQPCRFSSVSVESVAENGRIESLWMSRMYAQLMRATRTRKEIYKNRAVGSNLSNAVVCDGRFAMLNIHSLSRPIEGITAERKGYLSAHWRPLIHR